MNAPAASARARIPPGPPEVPHPGPIEVPLLPELPQRWPQHEPAPTPHEVPPIEPDEEPFPEERHGIRGARSRRGARLSGAGRGAILVATKGNAQR